MKRLINIVVFSLVFFGFTLQIWAQQRSQRGDRRTMLAIVGGTIVTMDQGRRVIENGAIVIRGDKIAFVGKISEIPASMRKARRFNATGKIVIPGLVNTHTHIPMVLFRGDRKSVV